MYLLSSSTTDSGLMLYANYLSLLSVSRTLPHGFSHMNNMLLVKLSAASTLKIEEAK
jgi:hypothetical protein